MPYFPLSIFHSKVIEMVFIGMGGDIIGGSEKNGMSPVSLSICPMNLPVLLLV
jgi:hypothetical protein